MNAGFFFKINNIAKNNAIARLQSEIYIFTQTIMPYFVSGNLEAVYRISYNFGFQNIYEMPQNRVLLHKENNGILQVETFAFGNNVGVSVGFLGRELIFAKGFKSSFWNDYTILVLIFQLGIYGLLIFFFFYQIFRPLKQLKNAINELKSGIYAKMIKIKNYNEIGELLGAFNEMNEKISRLIKARELITRNIAHELKTPLAKMKLALDLKDGIELKNDIKQYINSLDRISRNMLEYERIQASGFVLRKTEFLSESMVFEAIKSLEHSKISLNIIKNIKIKGDLALLSVAMKNLVENAIKYSSDGVCDIEISENGISFANNGDELKNDISYYFEPFYRGDIIQSGYGLGLSIVREILGLHKMDLEYSYNRRHVFFVRFNKEDE